jgi:hypothetical protein
MATPETNDLKKSKKGKLATINAPRTSKIPPINSPYAAA